MNVFINKIDEQSVRKRVSEDMVWLSVQTNSHAHRSHQTLISECNGMNELIY